MCVPVLVAGEGAGSTHVLHGLTEATDPAEQIDKFKIGMRENNSSWEKASLKDIIQEVMSKKVENSQNECEKLLTL